MSKRFIVLLVAAVALVFASAAMAAVTISQAPAGPGYQNLVPYPSDSGSGLCFSGGYVSLSDTRPIRLQFGWGAHTPSQMQAFFQYTSGTVTISTTDTTPTTVFNDAWSSTSDGTPSLTNQGIQWSALAPQTLQTPGKNPKTLSGYRSDYRGILSGLEVGTYTLTQTFTFSRPVQDGFASYSGTMTNTCTFNVVA